MKIVVVSDTHDNLPNFKKVCTWAGKEGVDLLIHCGDVTRVSTWEEATAPFSGDFRIVLGNADKGFSWNLKKKEKGFEGKVFSKYGEVEVEGGKIGFTHFPEFARDLACKGEHSIVFHGHTHKPWIKKRKGVRLVNPGNLAGIGCRPTFCYFSPEEERLELKLLKNL